MFTGEIPELEIDLSKVLHGEQYFKIMKPLQSESKLTNTFKIQVIVNIIHQSSSYPTGLFLGYFGQRKGNGFVG